MPVVVSCHVFVGPFWLPAFDNGFPFLRSFSAIVVRCCWNSMHALRSTLITVSRHGVRSPYLFSGCLSQHSMICFYRWDSQKAKLTYISPRTTHTEREREGKLECTAESTRQKSTMALQDGSSDVSVHCQREQLTHTVRDCVKKKCARVIQIWILIIVWRGNKKI